MPTSSIPLVSMGGLSKPLLVLHALAGMALLGASTHLAVYTARLAFKGAGDARPIARHARLVPWLFLGALTLGLVLYPKYRVDVRAADLDRHAVWASNLFDLKEQLVALAAPLCVPLFVLGRRAGGDLEPFQRALLSACAAALWSVVAFATIAGLVVTSVRSV